MSDDYIRTPEQDESRGSFDVSKLNTLADAEGNTAERKRLTQRRKSLQRASAISAGIGVFAATIANRLGTRIVAFILGIGSHLYLAYLALNGRFDGFFEHLIFDFAA